MNMGIAPTQCNHARQLFIQSSRWTGIGDNGAEQVYVCPDCGRFTIHARANGEHITVLFELCMADQLEAAGRYIKYLEVQAARYVRLKVIRQQHDAGNLTKDEALELLRGPLSPDDPSTTCDDSEKFVE